MMDNNCSGFQYAASHCSDTTLIDLSLMVEFNRSKNVSSIKQVLRLRVQLCYLSYLRIHLTLPSDALRLEAVGVCSCLRVIKLKSIDNWNAWESVGLPHFGHWEMSLIGSAIRKQNLESRFCHEPALCCSMQPQELIHCDQCHAY
jgi:hypothetical protein